MPTPAAEINHEHGSALRGEVLHDALLADEHVREEVPAQSGPPDRGFQPDDGS